MKEITPDIALDEGDLEFQYLRASGPGGQKVNKASVAVQLRYNLAKADLPEDVRARLARLAGKRMTSGGVLVIDARRHRSQEKNRQDAIQRLVALMRRAARPPKARRKTRPPASARTRRLDAKRRRSQTKQLRRRPGPQEG